jgi:hypothetical protein
MTVGALNVCLMNTNNFVTFVFYSSVLRLKFHKLVIFKLLSYVNLTWTV